MKGCFIVPAYDAEATVANVVAGLVCLGDGPVFVVDDGCGDDTARLAQAAGATVLAHGRNRGKGAAIRSGLGEAQRQGYEVAVTVDADEQHPPESAACIMRHPSPRDTLVLAVRDLRAEGAPSLNQFSNGISNFFLSRFSGQPLGDTQCGLRRYPVNKTLALGARDDGYAFEADVVLRAARLGWAIEQVPVRVRYPEDRRTHFHNVRDPARIIRAVLRTMFELR